MGRGPRACPPGLLGGLDPSSPCAVAIPLPGSPSRSCPLPPPSPRPRCCPFAPAALPDRERPLSCRYWFSSAAGSRHVHSSWSQSAANGITWGSKGRSQPPPRHTPVPPQGLSTPLRTYGNFGLCLGVGTARLCARWGMGSETTCPQPSFVLSLFLSVNVFQILQPKVRLNLVPPASNPGEKCPLMGVRHSD